ncbi:Asr1405/Asl0597 family protein [Leptolyngbya ohadii]|uniref:Asr1405/Asl0597 family protein n=1 Tax=Leptolyngbya ohadii TaxID=1962290 RepID=UPI001CED5DDA|nr:Asr1405/Asl0597 family protein [Leptolyngbya ohadii]
MKSAPSQNSVPHPNDGRNQTPNEIAYQADSSQFISVDRSVRWQICHRLQELDIGCDCLADGRMRVSAPTPLALIQVRSVLQQELMPRQVLLKQLERCWQVLG